MSIGESLLIDMQKCYGLGAIVKIEDILIAAEKLCDAAKLSLESLVPRNPSHASNFLKRKTVRKSTGEKTGFKSRKHA